MKIYTCIIALMAALLIGLSPRAQAQATDPVIQLSGVIVSGDSAYGIMGVHVYVRKASVGTVSNGAGLFRITVVPGDTVEFSHISYQKQRFIVPKTDELALTVMIDLRSNSVQLPVIEIFPYPTEEVFKEAFLALDISDQREENMKKSLNEEAMQRMVKNMGMDAAGNHRYYSQQQVNQIHNQFFAPSFSLLDPFAWARFIQSVKRGDLKKK